MPTVNKSIEIEAPAERVFELWTSYERFPSFMENVKEVRRIGADMTHWVAEAAGQQIEWDAKTLTERNKRVAWTAQGESGQSGEVNITPLGANRTKLDVRMDYKLDNKLQQVGAQVLGIDDRIVAEDLNNFKELVERGGF